MSLNAQPTPTMRDVLADSMLARLADAISETGLTLTYGGDPLNPHEFVGSAGSHGFRPRILVLVARDVRATLGPTLGESVVNDSFVLRNGVEDDFDAFSVSFAPDAPAIVDVLWPQYLVACTLRVLQITDANIRTPGSLVDKGFEVTKIDWESDIPLLTAENRQKYTGWAQ